MQTIEELALVIAESVNRALGDGFTLCESGCLGLTYNQEKQRWVRDPLSEIAVTNPLGAVLYLHQPKVVNDIAWRDVWICEVLQVPHQWIIAFDLGVDGQPFEPNEWFHGEETYREAYDLGMAFRKKFCPLPADGFSYGGSLLQLIQTA
jgi:hypothetical protein